MKAAAFAFTQPETLAEASALLAQPGTYALAGGQSLGPMLNLRLVRPMRLVQVNRLRELSAIRVNREAVTIGACVTHADIADGKVADIGQGILARVAEGIAYRAVRNQGTIGGSLCHADPAADWLTTLTALGARVTTHKARSLPVSDFALAAFRTALDPGELLISVRIPRLTPSARWGYVKACRKPGDFAHAMAAVLIDSARGIRRAVIGATGGAPIVLEADAVTLAAASHALDPRRTGLDTMTLNMQLVVLARALAEAGA